MKRITYLLLLLFSIQFAVSAQDGFKVSGYFKGFEGKTKLIINPILESHEPDMVNELVIYMNDGQFEFTGKVNGPTFYSIRIRPENYTIFDPKAFEDMAFFVENKNLTITGEKGNIRYSHVSGSVIQDQHEECEMYIKNKILDNHQKITADLLNKYRLEFTYQHPNYFVSVHNYSWFTKWLPVMVPKANAKEFYSQLCDSLQTSTFGRQIESYINNNLKINKALVINDKLYDFSLPDTLENKISLKSFKGKVLLLDFWFSGCGACRLEHKNYSKLYSLFNKKGFEILSVSSDRSKDKWLKAIKEDQMNWTCVWDENSRVTNYKYTITNFPTNFLIDSTGKIIARDIRGEALEDTISEMFKN